MTSSIFCKSILGLTFLPGFDDPFVLYCIIILYYIVLYYGFKQNILLTNNYGRGLRRWHSFLANTPIQAEILLHSPERAAAAIGLHVNAQNMEYMCFNLTGDISTLNGCSLKLVDKFTYKETVSHQPRQASTRDKQKHGQLTIGYRS